MSTNNIVALLIAVALIVGAIIYLDSSKAAKPSAGAVQIVPVILPEATDTPVTQTKESPKPPPALSRSLKEMRFERAKEITTPDGFINSLNPKGSAEPLTISEFVGKKVVLLDIWTYSCINCQRTLPYLKSWWEKYKDKGLVIIGLHTPEFEFEKKYENVLAAVKKFGLEYPVVLDNDYSTWRAYRNQYWPRKYLIDIDGYIVYDHIGEGGYEETERQIQKALAERMVRLGKEDDVSVAITEEKAVPRAGSPEIYFGAARNEYLANGEQGRVGAQTFVLPESFSSNRLYLGGEWNVANEYSESGTGKSVIVFQYDAREVYFVASSQTGVSVKVFNDDALVSSDEGVDVKNGVVLIKEDRLYKLINNPQSGARTLRLEIESPGLKAFTFTFG